MKGDSKKGTTATKAATEEKVESSSISEET